MIQYILLPNGFNGIRSYSGSEIQGFNDAKIDFKNNLQSSVLVIKGSFLSLRRWQEALIAMPIRSG